MLEKATEEEHGGNSVFTAGGFRFTHAGLDDLRTDVLTDLSDQEAPQIDMPPLPAETYLQDLMSVTKGLPGLNWLGLVGQGGTTRQLPDGGASI